MRSRRLRWLALLAVPIFLLLAAAVYLAWPDPGDPRLREFVHARPPVPIVFTSRTEPASLQPAPDEGEEFAYPGQPLWQAREGRLRLLKPNGTVHELTWGKPLPDGATLIDVMSPSVSIDGKRILFAGRKAPPDPGHFRLYQINVDGSDLRPLTGGPDDPGCAVVPPMRYRSPSVHTIMSDDERKRIDYDDIDPTELNFTDGRIAFASSRTPDLGRNHSRRSTTLWWMHADGRDKAPLTANRYNDRWPILLSSNFLAFSLWSHNQEVIAPGEREVRPWDGDKKSPHKPVDSWFGAFVQPTGGQFGMLLKPGLPVWRPRPLFNGRFVFQSRFGNQSGETKAGVSGLGAIFEALQAEPGLLMNAPSAGAADRKTSGESIELGPNTSRDEKLLSLATPGPCPDHHVIMAGMPLTDGGIPDPRTYGIWICRDDWARTHGLPLTAEQSGLKLLFDDPDFVDAEPVAVYPRYFERYMDANVSPPAGQPPDVKLADGSTYPGPSGTVFGSSLFANQHEDAPGQLSPNRDRPYFTAPPPDSMDHVRIWASYRDRFDDPVEPRIPGEWKLLLKVPVTGATFGAQVPSGIPTVLAGFDRQDRVLSWTNGHGDDPGIRFFAFAGDHYSATRPGGKHFCIGCHPGHSGLGRDDQKHQERVR